MNNVLMLPQAARICAAALALSALGACGSADSPASAAKAGSAQPIAWLDRVWVETGANVQPGSALIILSSGELIQMACFSPHGVWQWSRTSEGITWSEAGRTISARLSVKSNDRLKLDYTSDEDLPDREFVRAEAPFLCPDYPR